MYLSATTHFIVSIYSDFVAIFNQDDVEGVGLDDPNNFRNQKTYSQVVLEMVNVSLLPDTDYYG